jgi:hypothetical protein
VVTRGWLLGLRSCEFEVDIVAAGAGEGRRSLGVRFAGGAPSTCMQHGVNAAIEGSQGTELGRQYCKLHVRRRCSVVFLYFFVAVVVHQYNCGALLFSRSFSVRVSDRQDLREQNPVIMSDLATSVVYI